jgi:H+/Cl- antiporter ClcA/PII-like signaling protein
MPFRWNPREHFLLARYFIKWVLIASPVGAAIGSAVALFLWSLDVATRARWNHPWLLLLLPLAGFGVGLIYQFFGQSVEAGNNLIVDQIHEPGGGVPSRMAPLVLIGTVITHLFGGSAGREGTAVQMGGSIASTVCRWLMLPASDARTLLMTGVAAGFGAVFGTPLTGAIFAIEVLAIGRMSYDSLIPCLIGGIVGDAATTAWGIGHTQYHVAVFANLGLVATVPQTSWLLLGKVLLASVAFGLASVLFAELTHSFSRVFKWAVSWPALRPAVGGVIIIGLVYLVGTRDYLGLGVIADPHTPGGVSIVSSFQPGGATALSWWWKILFTAVTLSAGFKGGEVTPLFFIGATLGNTMAWLLGAPVDLFAALGFVAVFAGATNTPLACTIMAVELFGKQAGLLGSGFVIYAAVACFVSYLLSGHSGIYLSQRIGTPKLNDVDVPADVALRTVRELQPGLGDLFGRARDNWEGDKSDESLLEEELGMHKHKVRTREIGQVRIYMASRDKKASKGLRGIFGKPLYQDIIDAAKADGILNANAHNTHYGYSNNGQVQTNNSELPNPSLTLCVELIGAREELETFVRKHGDLLKGKVIVYKHMEHWEIGPHDSLTTTDAPQEELDVDVEDDLSDPSPR